MNPIPQYPCLCWRGFVIRALQLNFIMLLCILFLFSSCQSPQFKIVDADARFISNIDNRPIFSWKIESPDSGFEQAAVQVIISKNKEDVENNKGSIWDSGKVKTSNTTQFRYGGGTLNNGSLYYAKIRVWNASDNSSAWSETVSFCVPIDYPKDWKAKWITYEYDPEAPLPVYKKILDIPDKEKLELARLYIAAPGFYEAFLNGKKIGNSVLDPGQTNYEDYTYYSAYNLDLSDENSLDVLGVMLGNGWYNQNVVWGNGLIYGQPVFMAQLVVHYKDGSRKVIGTDESWTWKNGPISFSNIYAGESYDANKEVKDWFSRGTSDNTWSKAVLADNHPTNLLEQFAQPIEKIDSIKAKNLIKKDEGRYIFDFGQNFAGWVKLKIKGKKGQQIVLRCTEELDEKGDIDPRSTGVSATKVVQTQKYTCKGAGVEIWEPKFTYFGFRYVEVDGLDTDATEDLLTGIVVHSALPKTGSFSCSEDNINRLHKLAGWTIRSNLHSIPTDCPHREKCGWTGDAHAFIHALMYNYNAQEFMSKYVFDMRSSGRAAKQELYFGESFFDRSIVTKPEGIPTMIVPGMRTSGIATPDWGTAMTQVPWNLYRYYGDTLVLRNFYPDMKVWVDYIQAKNEDGIISHGLGDWCPPGGIADMECPVPVSSTAFHILDLKIMTKAAGILGMEEDLAYFRDLHLKTVESFNQHFFDNERFTYGSQTADIMALDIGMVPEELKQKVAASVVRDMHERHNGFISTGIFGISRIFDVLAENGFEDEVYRLLSKKGEHSFAHMWEKYDATTLWEVLPVSIQDDELRASRSHSHPMQSGYDAWFYSGIAGINTSPKSPGFKTIIFKPYLTAYLDHAKGEYESNYGKIVSSWEKQENDLVWKVTIPAMSEGEIFIPLNGKRAKYRIDQSEWKQVEKTSGFEFAGKYPGGAYSIQVKYE